MAALATLLTLSTAPHPAHAKSVAAAGTPLNIVLLMTDDQGWGDVGYRPGAIARTPNLDAMARNGLRLENFHAAAPVCSPTRGSVLTGRHPLRYGVVAANRGHLPREELTIAELLREAGYATGFFGKWHLGTLTTDVADSNRGGPGSELHFSPPWEHGFEVVFATEAAVPTYDPMLKPPGGGGWWLPVTDPRAAVPYGTAYWSAAGRRVQENLSGDGSRVVMDRAIAFIERAAARGQPFLALIWLHAPHMPWVAAAEHRLPYADQPEIARLYLGSVTALDAQVGRLRERLRTLGIADETLLWFTSDNGPEGPSPMLSQPPGRTAGLRGRKRSLYEGGIRVPTLLEWPGRIPRDGVSHEAAVSSDVLPTLLDLLGLRLPDARPFDGVSLRPLLEGRRLRRGEPIAFEYQEQLALIDGDYKIVRGGRDPTEGAAAQRARDFLPEIGDGFELYHLESDRGESVDLASQHPEIVRRMGDRLTRWRASVRHSRSGGDYGGLE
jgi:arylsulfatase A-like enzyme